MAAVVEQLGGNSPAGTTIAKTGTDKISLYGATPVVAYSGIGGLTGLAADANISTSVPFINAIITALRNIGIIV